jgi:hypothetical protein
MVQCFKQIVFSLRLLRCHALEQILQHSILRVETGDIVDGSLTPDFFNCYTGGVESNWVHLTLRPPAAIAQAVSCWLPTTAAWVHIRTACGVCGGQRGTGAGFLRVLRFPLPIIPPNSPLS